MKKFLVLTLLLTLFATGVVFAQESNEDKMSSLSYRNVNIHKILDHNDVYIVLYSKHGVGVGKVMIPKTWTKTNPKKVQFRTLPKGLNPFMTVVYKDGEFHKVILTISNQKIDGIWAVANPYADIGDSAQAETLVIEY
ncbi:MAG: hypothetical protein IKZ04_05940 [Spirochaetaceae bacterium]|nr:hypothetical protein [Spirochaetaceae bacterium]